MIFHVQQWLIQSNMDFSETTADGDNYLPWAIDIKIMLTAKDFIDDINKPNPQTQPNI